MGPRTVTAGLLTAAALIFPRPAAAGINAEIALYPVSEDTYLLVSRAAAGDFDGDGELDLAVTGSTLGPGDVTVLFGAGGGEFEPGGVYATDARPFLIAVADLDGDTLDDIVIGSDEASTLTVLYGAADGDLVGDEIALSGPIGALDTGDFDGDGVADLVVNRDDAVDVLLGTGGGAFAPPASYAHTFPRLFDWLAVGDFDGNGRDDLLRGGDGAPGTMKGPVQVRRSDADGALGSPQYSDSGAPPDGATVARLDGDARDDAVFSHPFSAFATVMTAAADGTLADPLDIHTDAHSAPIVTGDANGDGITDVAFNEPGAVSFFRGTGDGTFAPLAGFFKPETVGAQLARDLDGDGFDDLVLTLPQSALLIVALNRPRALPSASALDLGGITVGSAGQPRQLTIENDGQPPLHLGAAALQGAAAAEFTIVQDGCSGKTLAADAACTLLLGARPAAAGARTSELILPSDDPATPLKVPLSATGTAPPPPTPVIDTAAPVVDVSVKSRSLRKARKRGLRLLVSMSEPGTIDARLRLGREAAKRLHIARLVARAHADVGAPGQVALVLELRRRAARAFKPLRRVRLELRVRAADRAGNAATQVVHVTLHR